MEQILNTIYGINDILNAYIWLGIPIVIKGIVLAFIFAMIFRKQIKKYPIVFYIWPILLLIWFVFNRLARTLAGEASREWPIYSSWIADLAGMPYRLGLVASIGIGLITIVMFIGVLPKTPTVIKLFNIRAEMSIIGATLLVAHGIMRLDTALRYFEADQIPAFNLSFLGFGIIGPIILILILLPWITSFRFVRKRMKPKTWKTLQTYTSVPMFIGMLMFGCVVTMVWSVGTYPDLLNLGDIVTSTGRDNTEVAVSLATGISFASNVLAYKIYFVLLVAYISLRYKKVKDRKKKISQKLAE